MNYNEAYKTLTTTPIGAILVLSNSNVKLSFAIFQMLIWRNGNEYSMRSLEHAADY